MKEVHGSGGYGMLIGPHADKATLEAFRDKLKARSATASSRSRRWRSPPARPSSRRASRRATSTCGPSCSPARDSIRIVPGGLTRVALKEGSLVVNSSQGGGTKDTWVLDDALAML